MAKKVLISGYIGFANFGDDAMLMSLVNHLKKNKNLITALSASPKETARYFNINSIFYKDYFALIKAVFKTDILISGGGNLLQNETSKLSLFYYLFIIILAKLCFKKVIIFSQGIGPVNGWFSSLMVQIILSVCDMITVRDTYSQRLLSKWRIRSKYVYDAVWDLDTPEHSPKKIVGVQLRDFEGLNKAFYVNLAKYIDMFFSDFEIRIFSLQNALDTSECYKFEKVLRSRNRLLNIKIVMYKDPVATIEEFSKLNYLLAMRLHANIIALKMGVKILPISYNLKIDNFGDEFNVGCALASEEGNIHLLLTELTTTKQENSRIEDARKRKFEWSYIDTVINR